MGSYNYIILVSYHDVVVIHLVSEERDGKIGFGVTLDGNGHLSGGRRRIPVQTGAFKILIIVLLLLLLLLDSSQLDVNLKCQEIIYDFFFVSKAKILLDYLLPHWSRLSVCHRYAMCCRRT